MDNNRNEDKIIENLRKGLDQLDGNIQVNTPNINRFRMMVHQVEERKQARSRKEVFTFLITALVILSFETYAFNLSIVYFALIQSLAFISLPLGILAMKKRKSRQVSAE